MKKILLLTVAVLSVASGAYAFTAYFKYETRPSGMYKQCVYDYLGEDYVITVSSIKLCPMTIQIP